MGAKSRGNFAVSACIGPCANRDKECHNCIGKNKFKKISAKGFDNARKDS